MPRRASADKQFLEWHGGKWRVVVAVPRALHKRLGTKLKKSLNTDSLAVANRLKWEVVASLRGIIHDATMQEGGAGSSLTVEALEIAAARARADADAALLDEVIDMRGDELRGDPIRTDVEPVDGGPEYIYDPERERRAGLFVAMARGEATPLAHFHKQYLEQRTTKARTKGDDVRAIGFLTAWCEQNGVRPVLQSMIRKLAARFVDELHTVAPGRDNVTLNKYVSRLRQYWAWLEKREHVPDNVWHNLSREVAVVPHDEEEREFTDEEVVKLLEGPAPPKLRDVMLIGALTGARLDAIVDLKVRDCTEAAQASEIALFTFKPQKKEKKARAVPIHSALAKIVKRRTKGKKPEDDLFPEWPRPKKAGSQRERSFKTSNAFTAYRRSMGVDDRVEGRRRSRVNFHSFRRWFVTKAEQADQPEHIIAVVVGHKREGETLGRYSGGPQLLQARRCVEAVKLPKHRRSQM